MSAEHAATFEDVYDVMGGGVMTHASCRTEPRHVLFPDVTADLSPQHYKFTTFGSL